ncbi:MAG: hypothetical protein RQM92_10320 [Candidatus Syntrophopropionicum ammoniitolerans]
MQALTPDDGEEHSLKIVVKDAKGTNDFHTESYPPGKKVVKEVLLWEGCYTGVYRPGIGW